MRLLVALLVIAAACGGEPGRATKLQVFAASSLTEAFTELGEVFERDDPGTEVAFNFASSSVLARQIVEGAPADVFASADEPNMARLTEAGLVDEPAVFARNRLAIVVGKGNPESVRTLRDLGRPELVVVLCGEQVPCGRLADAALAAQGVSVSAASREENVKAVLTKVRLGEADAGIVYVTDAKAAGPDVEGVELPAELDVTTACPIATVRSAPNARAAAAFVGLVAGERGTEVLRRHGFL